jgi:hypothetical protein
MLLLIGFFLTLSLSATVHTTPSHAPTASLTTPQPTATPAPTSEPLTPFTPAPIQGLVIPTNNGDPVFVDACLGIGQAIAIQEAAQGSRVICTTRNLFTYTERSKLGPKITLWQLDYRIPGNALEVGIAFELLMAGKRPVRAYYDATVAINGRFESYNATIFNTIQALAYGPTVLKNFWGRNDATSAPMTEISISTFDAWTPLIGLMDGYNVIQFYRWSYTLTQGVQIPNPNTRAIITYCIFTNTTIMATSINPTAQANSGTLFGPQNDCVAQAFQTIATELGLVYGLPASFVALGAVQAASVPAAFGYDTIFDVSGPYSVAFGSVQQRALFSLHGNVFNEVYYEAVLAGFGIDQRNHHNCTQLKRSELDVTKLKFFNAADDVMARPRYAAFRSLWENAKIAARGHRGLTLGL